MQNDNNGSKFMNALTKSGNALLLNLLFILCSLPVITIGASISAYYYAMVKTVRRERSYAATEFFNGFKRSLLKGSLFTVAVLGAIVLLWFDREYFAHSGQEFAFVAVAVLDVLAILLLFFMIWIFPVISRFNLKIKEIFKLTLALAFKNPLSSLILIIGNGGCLYICYLFPVSFTLFLPCIWCFLATYVIEPVFKKYIKEPGDHEDGWYYDE